jgi:murein DD-endopeptidase MepM/ murein hydrolase activator NlpD
MSHALIEQLLKYQPLFHPVVPFETWREKLVMLDLSVTNTELTDSILEDVRLFSEWVTEKIQQSNARYAIGGYDEHRTVYSKSRVFDAIKDREPRRLHLGVDIWGQEGTAVMAPLDGIVHSFAYNNQAGDYGATIILSHRLERQSFFSLYGHLNLQSLKELREGKQIKKGEIFAALGSPAENGNWPPHLHFQLIETMDGWKGDYPGVCPFSEKENWLANSPDPELILQLKQYL